MANVAHSTGVGLETDWSPARLYLVISGVFLVIASTVGFVVDASFPTGSGEVGSSGSGYIFGILETNGWHNLAGLASAALALGFALKAEWARFGALLKGAIYVVVTSAIAIWGPDTFWIASNASDQVVHGTLAVGGIASGLMTPRRSP